ncbi:LytTR family transcriptional regulator DNA-binding domain-containing protein [Fulvivirga sp.]|uniref:LytR/AlgR family response regulator transcription factor n=1 Tax=Fulvivirga sp. TaxID=1931237 RepID=UPI0032EC9640
MIKAIIIDDEQLARDLIKKFLSENSTVEVVAECTNGFDGAKAIAEHKPDLIFLDVQMPKLTGFEMLEIIDERPIIIFSTAFDQYAIKAFEQSAADYLLKPYSKARFQEALAKAIGQVENKQPNGTIEKVLESKQAQEQLDRVVIKNGSKILILSIDNISHFEAQDDYVAIYSEGKKYLKQLTMKYLENSLPKDQFVRVHRSFIVAIAGIDKLEPYSKDAFIAILKSGDKVSVSRSGYNALKEALNF